MQVHVTKWHLKFVHDSVNRLPVRSFLRTAGSVELLVIKSERYCAPLLSDTSRASCWLCSSSHISNSISNANSDVHSKIYLTLSIDMNLTCCIYISDDISVHLHFTLVYLPTHIPTSHSLGAIAQAAGHRFTQLMCERMANSEIARRTCSLSAACKNKMHRCSCRVGCRVRG